MGEELSIPSRGGRQNAIVTYETLANIERSCVRTETLIVGLKEAHEAVKKEGDERWKDHEVRLRLFELTYMKEDDIKKLTDNNASRIEKLENEAKTKDAVKTGITSFHAKMWAIGVAVASMVIPFINFVMNHLEKFLGLVK